MAENNPLGPMPRQLIIDAFHGRYLSQAIYVATKKRIADFVTASGDPKNCDEVASYFNCDSTNLYRLLSYMSAYGIFEEKDGQNFVGNDLSEALRESVDRNCFDWIHAHGIDQQWLSVMNLESALEKNNETTPFEHANGEKFYSFLAKNQKVQRHFDLGVASSTIQWHTNVPKLYDFSGYSSVVDLAGGCGGLLKAIMLANPKIKGSLFEVPSVLKNVLPDFSNDDFLKSRFNTVEGDFLKEINCEADLFTVAGTLHCFEDTRLSIILQNIAKAMGRKTGSRLLILEGDYEKSFIKNKPSAKRQLDMTMMVIMGGRERSLTAWENVLNKNGLRILKKVDFPPNAMGLECELV